MLACLRRYFTLSSMVEENIAHSDLKKMHESGKIANGNSPSIIESISLLFRLHLSFSLILSLILSHSALSISCILMRQAAVFQIRPIFKRQFFCPSPNMSSHTWNGFNEANCKGQIFKVIILLYSDYNKQD